MEHKNVDTTQKSTSVINSERDTVVGVYKEVCVKSVENKTDSTAVAIKKKSFASSSMEKPFK